MTRIRREHFMVTSPILNERDIDAFKRDGFVIKRAGFGSDEMRQIQRWSDELATLPEASGRHWVYHEQSRLDPNATLIARIENIQPFHDGFALLNQSLLASVGQLLGEDAVLFKDKINFKMPGGDGFTPHQDSQAGWEDYASDFINVVVCIDPATIENGCLQLVAGHHRRGLFRRFEPLSDKDMAGMVFKPYPTEPGDLIFFDSYTPHASDPNHTATTRRMYFVTFNRSSEGDHRAQYYRDKHQNYPPNIDRHPDRDYVFRV